jgi:hypothetical protein
MNSHINSEIKIFNKKLCKLAKIFPHVNVIKVDNNRQQYTTHGLHLNGLGTELLFSNLLLHIYSALEKDSGSIIALAWRDNHSQVISSTAISDNQDLITNIILAKLISTTRLAKDGLASCVVNGNMNMGTSRMMETRISNRTTKAHY